MKDTVSDIGTNGKMSEIHAAMGLVSLQELDKIVAHNRRNYQLYHSYLDDLPGLTLRDAGNNYHYIVLDVAEGRDELHQRLQNKQVLVRRYFYPGCHRSFPYSGDKVQLPITDAVAERALCLPTGLAIDERDIERICGIIRRRDEATNG